MPNYIDKDKFIRDLIDNRNFYPAIVKNAIENAPTEDVVPRSEVEKLQAEIKDFEISSADARARLKDIQWSNFKLAKENKELKDKLEQAKQEVARKIFEDFTKHKVCTNEEDYRVLAERKKKYIGE